jgi:hypothetical protein
MRAFRSCLVVAIAVFLAAPAGAAPISNLITITQEGAGSMMLSSEQLGCGDPDADGIFTCQGSGFVPGNPDFTWVLDNWNIAYDEDPFVSQAFGFTNVGATSAFTITSIIPILPVLPATLMGGSTGGSVTDANFNGTGGMGTVAGSPFYTGLIDGAAPAGAQLHPILFRPGVGFPGTFNNPGGTANIPAINFLPAATVGPAAFTNIGIQNRFNLAGGDSISATNFFVVNVIPEPSTAALFGLALAGMTLIARRRSL